MTSELRGFTHFECCYCHRQTELFALLVSTENYDPKTGKNTFVKKKNPEPGLFFCPTCYEDFKEKHSPKQWKVDTKKQRWEKE